MLELLDGLIVARYDRRSRVAALQTANVGLERLRKNNANNARSAYRNNNDPTNRNNNIGFRLASTRAPESVRARLRGASVPVQSTLGPRCDRGEEQSHRLL